MRVLWIDADENPWIDASGWKVLDDFGLQVRRVSTVQEARAHLHGRQYELIVARAELDGVLDFLVTARNFLLNDPRKIILLSSVWNKEQFREHARGEGSAHRYAKVPMPPEGFVSLVAELFAVAVDELNEFHLNAEIPKQAASKASALPRRKKAPVPEVEDIDVLKKYLRIKEEQLEISDSERDELAIENERLQKEAQELQIRLREFEHSHEELQRKIVEMEAEREGILRTQSEDRDRFDREEKILREKIKGLESEISESNEKYENLRLRVGKDIRKIRANERDLEARLELLRKDSSTLLGARDEKVLELQRKVDALEFDLDQVQDSRVQAQMESERYLAKLSRVSRALQIAIGMIEDDVVNEEELDELEPLMGGAGNATETDPVGASVAAPTQLMPPEALAKESAVESESMDSELQALANDGEPTQMLGSQVLESMEGEPESNSG